MLLHAIKEIESNHMSPIATVEQPDMKAVHVNPFENLVVLIGNLATWLWNC